MVSRWKYALCTPWPWSRTSVRPVSTNSPISATVPAAGAATDVPLRTGMSMPLWRHPGVTVTPHAAALTEPRTSVGKIVENVERVRRGQPALNLVDFEAGY